MVLIAAENSPVACGRSSADEDWATRRSRPSDTSRNDVDSDGKIPDSTSSEVERVSIAIVGGGIGGLTTAIALSRQGVTDFKVYERAPSIRNLSQGILAISSNGQWALDQIDPEIVPRCLNSGVHLKAASSKTIKEGAIEKEIHRDLSGEGTMSITITWHRLQNVLASFTPEQHVVTGRSLESFVEDDEGVLLRFEDGSRVSCDVAIACDGTFSAARRQMHPDEPPLYFGQLNWNAVIPRSTIPEGLVIDNTLRGISRRSDPYVHAMIADAGCGDAFVQLRVGDEAHAKELSGNGGRGGLGLPGVKAKLLALVEGCEDLSAALAAIPEETLFERCIIAHDTAKEWRSPGGRVALVGDSAHAVNPMIGQGANSTFESVYAVAEALGGCGGDWVAGLARYEEARRPHADLIQKYANAAALNAMRPLGLFAKEEEEMMTKWVRTPPPERSELPAKLADSILGFNLRECGMVSSVYI